MPARPTVPMFRETLSWGGGDMKRDNPDDKQVPQQGAGENDEEIRHKGGGRSTSEEKQSGPQPDGNGGTGQPAAFPPHN